MQIFEEFLGVSKFWLMWTRFVSGEDPNIRNPKVLGLLR